MILTDEEYNRLEQNRLKNVEPRSPTVWRVTKAQLRGRSRGGGSKDEVRTRRYMRMIGENVRLSYRRKDVGRGHVRHSTGESTGVREDDLDLVGREIGEEWMGMRGEGGKERQAWTSGQNGEVMMGKEGGGGGGGQLPTSV